MRHAGIFGEAKLVACLGRIGISDVVCHVTREVIRGHVIDGAAGEDALVAKLAAIEQHLAAAYVIRCG